MNVETLPIQEFLEITLISLGSYDVKSKFLPRAVWLKK